MRDAAREEDTHREILGAIMSACRTQSRNQSHAVPSFAFRLLLNKNIVNAMKHAVYHSSVIHYFIMCPHFVVELYYNITYSCTGGFGYVLILKISPV